MTDKKDKALKLALEALEEINKLSIGENAICLPAEIDTAMDAIREALADSALERMAENARELGLDYEAAQQQEPVGEAYLCDKCQTPFDGAYYCPECGHNTATKESVYTSPPASKPWVGLTDDEIDDIYQGAGKNDLKRARAVEAKLKEKNG